MGPVRVRIRDNEYLVKGEEDEDQLNEIVEYVNSKLKEVEETSEGLSEKKTAILAALNIAGDYFRLLREREKMLAKIQKRTESLIYNIDTSIG